MNIFIYICIIDVRYFINLHSDRNETSFFISDLRTYVSNLNWTVSYIYFLFYIPGGCFGIDENIWWVQQTLFYSYFWFFYFLIFLGIFDLTFRCFRLCPNIRYSSCCFYCILCRICFCFLCICLIFMFDMCAYVVIKGLCVSILIWNVVKRLLLSVVTLIFDSLTILLTMKYHFLKFTVWSNTIKCCHQYNRLYFTSHTIISLHLFHYFFFRLGSQ